MFSSGHLVICKVQVIHDDKTKTNNRLYKFMIDLDMHESRLLENQDKISFQAINVLEKHRGVVIYVESYGFFICLDTINVDGLAHIYVYSDEYIKNISSLYDPKYLVKVLVMKLKMKMIRNK